MNKYHIALHPGCLYHIYNQAVGSELLFRDEENFKFFLAKYSLHVSAICDTYCYNLMPDHFHFIIRIRSKDDCIIHFEKVKQRKFNEAIDDISDFLMERFSNLCNSYT